MTDNRITGVVLAGGQNRRMGGKLKALLSYEGRLFIERQLEELGKLCSEIMIVANDHKAFETWITHEQSSCEGIVPVRAVRDLLPGSGPLAGLQAAMAAARTGTLWVVACDMPFASAEAAEAMSQLLHGGSMDAVVPVIGGKVHPLHALYRRRCRHVVDELLKAEQYRMMELLRRLKYAAADDRFFLERRIMTKFAVNVNDPERYEKLQQRND